MADDPENPFSRASAWPRMPSAPMRIGPLPKAPPAPEPPSITPVFTRPIAAPPTRPLVAPPTPPPPTPATPTVAAEPPPLVVAPLRDAPRRGRSWKPFAIAAGLGGVAATGLAVFLTREPPAAQPGPRLAAAVVEPAPAAPPAVIEPAANPPVLRPQRVAASRVKAPALPAPAQPDPAPAPLDLGPSIEIPPIATPDPERTAPLFKATPLPTDPDAPIETKPPG